MNPMSSYEGEEGRLRGSYIRPGRVLPKGWSRNQVGSSKASDIINHNKLQ